MGPDLWELFEYGEADDEVAAIIRLGHFATVPQGVRVVAQFEDIVTVRLSRRDIPKISGAPEVSGMSAGDTYLGPDLELNSPENNSSAPISAGPTDIRRPEGLAMTGRGIVLGVVDWGFDFAHPDFLKSDGTSRILALWDQRGGKRADSPKPFGYGIVHTRDAINRALKEKDPYVALKYHPADADTGFGCHGTHVTSIAAGSGGDGRPCGIAPEADLVLVHNAPWDGLESGKLGDSVTLLEGIEFISQTAAASPWVINLSMGRHGEQHDGSTLVELGLDAAVRSVPGRAVVLSTGNYYNKRIHASGQLRPTEERTFAWVINEGTPSDYNQLEVWYSWQDKFEVTVSSPGGAITARAKLGEKIKLLSGGKEVGNIYHRAQEPNTLDHHITIFLYKSAPAGEWDITVSGTDVIHGDYHAWIEREVSCPACQSHFREQDADSRSTTGTICNGRRTIAVGAYDNHDEQHRLAPFSSVGPTRDGRLKPDLCAPGVAVLAARSAPRAGADSAPLLTSMSGTSMASPHVAGTIVLMFQAAVKPLRIEDTHNLLLGNAQRVSIPENNPERIGIGFLDVEAAVEAASGADHSSRTFKPVPPGKPAPPQHKPSHGESGERYGSARNGELALAVIAAANEAEAIGGSRERGSSTPMPVDSESEGEAAFLPTNQTSANTAAEYWFLDGDEIASARGRAEMKRTLSTYSSRNLVQPLIDGEEYMAALHDDLALAGSGDFFHLTAWRLDIAQDLRPGAKPTTTSPSRFDNLLRSIAARGAFPRALIYKALLGGFAPSSVGSQISENTEARRLFNKVGGIGIIDERYAPTVGSHHQKSAIIQRAGEAVAFCGGIDISPDRWDTTRHDSDARRTPEMWAGWHDVHLRLRGPAVLDIELNFRDRWNARAEVPSRFPDSKLPPVISAPLPPVAPSPGTHHVQVLRTYACKPNHSSDFAPNGEFTCLASYLKAIGRAQKYIYIEDQYLVSEELAAALDRALDTISALVILVPAAADSPPVRAFNYHQQQFIRTVSARHPCKVFIFHPVQPKSKAPIYVHAKVMIIDDIFAVVGSPNINRRSMTHDTELAAAVIDADVVNGVCRFARDLRLRLWSEHLGIADSDPRLADPIRAVAEWDRQALAAKYRVRYHTTPSDQKEAKYVWDKIADPDGRCVPRTTTVAKESSMDPAELADQIVAERRDNTQPLSLLHEWLQRQGMDHVLRLPGASHPISAAQLFDYIVYRASRGADLPIDRHLEVVAAPRSLLTRELQPGDMLLRRMDGNRAHLAVIASPTFGSLDDVLAAGYTPEQSSAGHYVLVVEGGARPHQQEDGFTRRVADQYGRVPRDQLVLRPRPQVESQEGINATSLLLGATLASSLNRPAPVAVTVTAPPSAAPPALPGDTAWSEQAVTGGPFADQAYGPQMVSNAARTADLTAAIASVRATLSAADRQRLDKVAFVIAKLGNNDNPVPYAGVKENDMFFTASMAKYSMLFASFELLSRVRKAAPAIIAADPSTAADPKKFFKAVHAVFDKTIWTAIPWITTGLWRQTRIGELSTDTRREQIIGQVLKAAPDGRGGLDIALDDTHRDHLTKIFKEQRQNAPPRACMHRLGYSYVNGALAAGGFLGLDSNLDTYKKGLWMADDIGGGWPQFHLPTSTGGSTAEASTCIDLANLLTAMHRRTLIDAVSSQDMLDILQGSGSWISLACKAMHFNLTSFGAKVGHDASTDARVGAVKSEGAIMTNNGNDFAVVWQNFPDSSPPDVSSRDTKIVFRVIDEVTGKWP